MKIPFVVEGSLERNDLSYVWQKDAGHRIVIVIDDAIKLAITDDGAFTRIYAPRIDAAGIGLLFTELVQRDDTLALGLFALPSSHDEPSIEALRTAVAQWCESLDSTRHDLCILIDRFYGSEQSDDLGGDAVYHALRGVLPHARCAFFSKAGGVVFENDDIGIPTIGKVDLEISLSKGHGYTPALRSFLFGGGASNWSTSQWQRVRAESQAACAMLAKHHDEWVSGALALHHLPHGDKMDRWWPTPQTESALMAGISAVAKAIESIAPEACMFPRYGWSRKSSQDGHGWVRPPLRGLAQPGGEGHDLFTAIHLVAAKVREDFRYIDLNLIVRSGENESFTTLPTERGGLWFNVSALCQGLFILAQSFNSEVRKYADDANARVMKSRPGAKLFEGDFDRSVRVRGELYWSIRCDGDCLLVTIAQRFVRWTVDYADGPEEQGLDSIHGEYPSVVFELKPLPAVEDAKKKVAEAYGYFAIAGAQVNVDGDLVLTVSPSRDRT